MPALLKGGPGGASAGGGRAGLRPGAGGAGVPPARLVSGNIAENWAVKHKRPPFAKGGGICEANDGGFSSVNTC